MTRVSNFNAGPAGLPLPALERARDELIDFEGTGMSIMEHSHRGKAYDAVHNEALGLLRELLGVPETHHILFLQGGATQMFAQVPMNFLGPGKCVDYLVTGHWSERAVEEAKLVAGLIGGSVRIAANTREKEGIAFRRLPTPAEIKIDTDAVYAHITTNNTIFGTQWPSEPDVRGVPLVADASSDILGKKIDVSRYALIYGGAQKNLGPSGVTIVIVAKQFLERARTDIPGPFRFKTYAEANSLYNTPPTFGIYLTRNVLAWIKSVGGLAQIEAWNREKASLLYGAIDAAPDYFRSPVERASRSAMNVVFRLPNAQLDEKFVKEATAAGMVGLKGYRSTGGIRASLYNAVSVADVEKLVTFMKAFAAKNPVSSGI
jgi:phosphoserine aminotransferase